MPQTVGRICLNRAAIREQAPQIAGGDYHRYRAAGVLATERSANILRVHDVAETVDAVKVIQALRGVTS